ncbi:MAG: hypothetical protein Q4G07_11810 [Oscillospiraceae bacterium]|nr:hypothetical protein [Oscillospiraceae bacterium]
MKKRGGNIAVDVFTLLFLPGFFFWQTRNYDKITKETENSRSEAEAIFLAIRPVAAIAVRARPLKSNFFISQ